MIILYYSIKTIFPALLASIKHGHPALSLEQAWPRAIEWLHQNYRATELPFFLKRFGESPEGDTLYLMTASVPPPVLKRTLNGLTGLIKSGQDATWLLPAGPLPSWPGRWGAAGPGRTSFWMEIEVLVEQTRLQIELIKEQ